MSWKKEWYKQLNTAKREWLTIYWVLYIYKNIAIQWTSPNPKCSLPELATTPCAHLVPAESPADMGEAASEQIHFLGILVNKTSSEIQDIKKPTVI